VVGIPDAVLGQAVKAFVVAQNKAVSATAILAHCRAHLEDYMIPKSVEFRDTLPKSPSGKIQKQQLI